MIDGSVPRTALVTGCSGDIGAAVCRRIDDAGYTVVGWDVVPPRADLPLSSYQPVDLTAAEVPETALHDLAAAGALQYVVHVVGGSDVEELRQTDLARVPAGVFERTVALNLFSAHTVIRATVDLLRATDGDRSYTLTSSTNAFGGYGAPGYSAAKAGLHGLVAALAGPLARDRIRINAVALGTTRTANYVRLGRLMGRETDFDSIGSRTPRGSVLSPDEAAAALTAVAIANPALSGEVVVADAGQHLARR
ncbi:SDR family NAD(P)-dependent oxidoreductase [Micromonospora cathayae]|uniref:SDR family oxidoreductase n=1 Tax=Micromonospora cathayae TaxID=3028804 RepID=A0ABY7ZKW5_9ACTN|nr:SDR family oxidoreductase [Micromonospora sp. HUAS 3]WDZ83601.1 SDR family oxidoreductase [Micromonospora sp. HUAS 3]